MCSCQEGGREKRKEERWMNLKKSGEWKVILRVNGREINEYEDKRRQERGKSVSERKEGRVKRCLGKWIEGKGDENGPTRYMM